MNGNADMLFHIEASEHRAARSMRFAGLGVDDALVHGDAPFADALYLGEHFDAVVEICRVMEIAVEIDDHNRDFVKIKRTFEHFAEIERLAHVEEIDIHGIVQVSEHVDVGKSDLQWNIVAIGPGHGGYARIFRYRNLSWFHRNIKRYHPRKDGGNYSCKGSQ